MPKMLPRSTRIQGDRESDPYYTLSVEDEDAINRAFVQQAIAWSGIDVDGAQPTDDIRHDDGWREIELLVFWKDGTESRLTVWLNPVLARDFPVFPRLPF